MALTAVVSKVEVKRTQPQLFSIKLKLVVNDGTNDVIDKEFTQTFNKVHGQISETVIKFIEDMQEEVDVYKSENQIFTHTQMNTAVSDIQAGLQM